MPAIAVIGAHWGDEGKGRIVDLLAQKVNMVVRYSGGDNAGHTVINPLGEFKLHLVPSGIFGPGTCVIGNGVVVNPERLLEEIALIESQGVTTTRLLLSDRANLIMPYHQLLDRLEEAKRGAKAIGTTGRGIGPAFADKAARLGIRAGDLLDREYFRERLRRVLAEKNAILTGVFGEKPLSLEAMFEQYCQYGERLKPHIRETSQVIREALERGELVLLEGAQGTLLDPDFGTYPYTTSSSSLAAAGCLGAGISLTHLKEILGVFKAYCTRVGAGPLPTELNDQTGELLRERGHEYGTTTSRPRRCGWFDAVASRHSTQINGFTGAIITRLDILDSFKSLKICTGYRLDGEVTQEFPASITRLERCQPVYEELPGWETDTGDIRDYRKLPLAARRYLARIEELIACPIAMISVGSKREQIIYRRQVI
ncbi:MAG: adenylosuccinate synthase [Chloroflexota bacterium]